MKRNNKTLRPNTFNKSKNLKLALIDKLNIAVDETKMITEQEFYQFHNLVIKAFPMITNQSKKQRRYRGRLISTFRRLGI